MRRHRGITIVLFMAFSLLIGCAQTPSAEYGGVKIGIVQYAEHPALDHAREGFEARIKKVKPDVEIDTVNLQGDQSLATTAPKKFAGDEYALVYAIATPAVEGARRALPDKDIIFSAVTDPVTSGLVPASDAIEHVTGVSDAVPAQEPLAEFAEAFPDVKTVGTLYSTSESNSEVQIKALETACATLGLELKTVGVNSVNEVSQAIATLANDIDVYYALTDNTVAAAMPIVAKTLLQRQIPSLSSDAAHVASGLLWSTGVDYYAHGEQAADIALELLDGADITDIPVEANQHTAKTVNTDTAKALGITNLDQLTDETTTRVP